MRALGGTERECSAQRGAARGKMCAVSFFWKPPAMADAALMQHPHANASALLGGEALRYLLRRSARRRSIGLRVDAQGLSVSAPLRAPLREVERAIRERADWIARSMVQVGERQRSLQQAAVVWSEGGSLPFMGQAIRLRLDARAARAQLEGDELHLPLPAAADEAAVRRAAQTWLLGQARRQFTRQLDHWAPLLGVRWQRLTVSSARTRWGSASAGGNIRLNRRLIHLPPELVDYVVVHELAHLHEMNHGARFWQHVARALPDYEARRERLKNAVTPPWDD